jgi:hypothetical protein
VPVATGHSSFRAFALRLVRDWLDRKPGLTQAKVDGDVRQAN